MNNKEFYPAQFGAFNAVSTPFTGSKQAYKVESSFDPNDPNGPDGNEDNTEWEEEDGTACDQPKYRTLVRNKKKALKDQYGKGHFSIGECGIKPLHEDLDPTLWNVLCGWDCSKEKNKDKNCCETNREKAVKREKRREERWAWDRCRVENKGVWVPGWRAKWKDYKNADGLATLKAQSKCEAPDGTPTPNTTPQPGSVGDLANMSCELLRDTFNIVPGKSWGTATPEAIKAWQMKQCFVVAPTYTEGPTPGSNSTNPTRGLSFRVVDKIMRNKLVSAIIVIIILVIIVTAVILSKSKKTT